MGETVDVSSLSRREKFLRSSKPELERLSVHKAWSVHAELVLPCPASYELITSVTVCQILLRLPKPLALIKNLQQPSETLAANQNLTNMTHNGCISVFRTVSQTSVDSDIATAFQRRFHISVDESEQNNVSKSRGTPLVVVYLI